MPNAEGARSEQPVVHSSEQVAANTKEILVLAPVVELETQSAAGKPNYLAVEQRSDEFAAKLLGLDDPPALPVGAGLPALDPAAASVRLLGHLSSDTLERAPSSIGTWNGGICRSRMGCHRDPSSRPPGGRGRGHP